MCLSSETKVCTKCGVDKPANDFYNRNRNGKVYKKSRCIECELKTLKQWRIRNFDYNKQRAKDWRKNNPELSRALTESWRKRNPDKVKAMDYRSHKKAEKRLSNFIVRSRLKKKGFDDAQITPDIISASRALIKLKQKVKEIGV